MFQFDGTSIKVAYFNQVEIAYLKWNNVQFPLPNSFLAKNFTQSESLSKKGVYRVR